MPSSVQDLDTHWRHNGWTRPCDYAAARPVLILILRLSREVVAQGVVHLLGADLVRSVLWRDGHRFPHPTPVRRDPNRSIRAGTLAWHVLDQSSGTGGRVRVSTQAAAGMPDSTLQDDAMYLRISVILANQLALWCEDEGFLPPPEHPSQWAEAASTVRSASLLDRLSYQLFGQWKVLLNPYSGTGPYHFDDLSTSPYYARDKKHRGRHARRDHLSPDEPPHARIPASLHGESVVGVSGALGDLWSVECRSACRCLSGIAVVLLGVGRAVVAAIAHGGYPVHTMQSGHASHRFMASLRTRGSAPDNRGRVAHPDHWQCDRKHVRPRGSRSGPPSFP